MSSSSLITGNAPVHSHNQFLEASTPIREDEIPTHVITQALISKDVQTNSLLGKVIPIEGQFSICDAVENQQNHHLKETVFECISNGEIDEGIAAAQGMLESVDQIGAFGKLIEVLLENNEIAKAKKLVDTMLEDSRMKSGIICIVAIWVENHKIDKAIVIASMSSEDYCLTKVAFDLIINKLIETDGIDRAMNFTSTIPIIVRDDIRVSILLKCVKDDQIYKATEVWLQIGNKQKLDLMLGLSIEDLIKNGEFDKALAVVDMMSFGHNNKHKLSQKLVREFIRNGELNKAREAVRKIDDPVLRDLMLQHVNLCFLYTRIRSFFPVLTQLQ